MSNSLSDEYDAIIIGAGISGLVCGCYLAKARMRVLIVEKNDHPGGCCTSFKRDGFLFDSAAHSLGGMSALGPIGNIFSDFDMSTELVKRSDPSYSLIVKDDTFFFWNSPERTLRGLQKRFPSEKSSLKKFFNFVQNASLMELLNVRELVFKDLLNQYFKDRKLKAVIAFPLLGNIGVDPFKTSAFTAIKFYNQYVFDGGYHFRQGMQELPDLLVKKFMKMGGEIKLSSIVDKIVVDGGCAKGIFVKGKRLKAKYIISNVDSQQTFFHLVGNKYLTQDIKAKLSKLQTSGSLYVLYLGLQKPMRSFHKVGTTYWYVNNYNLGRFYGNIEGGKEKFDWIALRVHEGRRSLQLLTLASYRNRAYWFKRDNVWKKSLISKMTKHISNLSNLIILKESATPQTVYHWTLNSQGATCGWASIPSQLALPEISQTTFISNLFLTGHWTTMTLGLPGVAAIGKSTANLILRKDKRL